MILYKLRITERACLDLTKEIATEVSGDICQSLMMQLQVFNQVKIACRELNRPDCKYSLPCGQF